ncbi:MAG: hypothetical protein ABWY05_01540 [Noviherbaspirillum sp.]
MKQELFRKTALENLSAPQQLNAALQITRPRAWIALAAILLILAASVVWSVAGTLPASVEGQGIIIREGGTFNIVSFGNGVVTEMSDLKLGDDVRRGQLLGRIAQPELEQQIQTQRTALRQLQEEESDIAARMSGLRPVQENSVRLQQAVLQRYEQSRQQALAAESEIDNARTQLQKLSVEQIETAALRENRLREIGNRVLQAKNRLDDLLLQHDLASRLTSPHDGIVVETMGMMGDVVRNGQPVLSIEVDEGVLGDLPAAQFQCQAAQARHAGADFTGHG